MLIFVFDVVSQKSSEDLAHYESCLNALSDLSNTAKIFVLIHKMDLVPENSREKVFQEQQ